MLKRSVLTILLFLIPVLAGAEAPLPVLSIDVREARVTVSNSTPGGSVVLFSCARVTNAGRTHIARQALVLRDDDGDGTIQFTPEIGVPLRSVWIAVDFSSGALASGARAGFPLSVGDIAASSFKKDAEGEIARLEQEMRRLILLLVRPGAGAWTLFARDGKDGDKDRSANARLALDFSEARSVEGKDAAPKHLKKDDVVVVVDPSHLDIYVARIGK